MEGCVCVCVWSSVLESCMICMEKWIEGCVCVCVV